MLSVGDQVGSMCGMDAFRGLHDFEYWEVAKFLLLGRPQKALSIAKYRDIFPTNYC